MDAKTKAILIKILGHIESVYDSLDGMRPYEGESDMGGYQEEKRQIRELEKELKEITDAPSTNS